MAGPEITTDRLVISQLRPADSAAVFAYRSLPEVSRYQHWEPRSLDDVTAFVEGLVSVEFDTPGSWFQFGVRLRETGELVGDLGVRFLEDGQQAEIGITLEPDSQGQGLAVEAVTAVIDHLFRQSGTHRIVASVDPRNARSLELMRRVGMRQEAHFRQSLRFKGEWADDVVFAVLRSDWLARRTG